MVEADAVAVVAHLAVVAVMAVMAVIADMAVVTLAVAMEEVYFGLPHIIPLELAFQFFIV